MTWGYILQGPGRPPLTKQRAVMQVFGLLEGKFPPVWTDKIEAVKRGRPRPEETGTSALASRNDLLLATQPGDTVVVADPYCLGISELDAKWFLAELEAAGALLTVHSEAYQVKPGGDASELLAAMRRRIIAAKVRRHRDRRSRKKHRS